MSTSGEDEEFLNAQKISIYNSLFYGVGENAKNKIKKSLIPGKSFGLTVDIAFDTIEHSYGRVAERLGKGLQNPLLRFKSGRDLKKIIRPDGGIGRHKGLKIPRSKGRASSSLALGTTVKILQ